METCLYLKDDACPDRQRGLCAQAQYIARVCGRQLSANTDFQWRILRLLSCARACVRACSRLCVCARVGGASVTQQFLFSFFQSAQLLDLQFFGEVIDRKSGPREEKTREREVTVPPAFFFSLFIRLEPPPPPRLSVSSASLVLTPPIPDYLHPHHPVAEM